MTMLVQPRQYQLYYPVMRKLGVAAGRVTRPAGFLDRLYSGNSEYRAMTSTVRDDFHQAENGCHGCGQSRRPDGNKFSSAYQELTTACNAAIPTWNTVLVIKCQGAVIRHSDQDFKGSP